MKVITKEELDSMLTKHKLWLESKDGGARADLNSFDLRDADLRYADLRRAGLRRANLQGVDLRRADLRGAIWYGAKVDGAVLPTGWKPLQYSPEGKFIAWKKLRNNAIAKLEIPEEARRVNSTTRSCRAEYAKVLAVYDKTGKEVDEGYSVYDKVLYKVGEIVNPDSFNDDVRETCTSGIHYFLTRKEAEDYVF